VSASSHPFHDSLIRHLFLGADILCEPPDLVLLWPRAIRHNSSIFPFCPSLPSPVFCPFFAVCRASIVFTSQKCRPSLLFPFRRFGLPAAESSFPFHVLSVFFCLISSSITGWPRFSFLGMGSRSPSSRQPLNQVASTLEEILPATPPLSRPHSMCTYTTRKAPFS